MSRTRHQWKRALDRTWVLRRPWLVVAMALVATSLIPLQPATATGPGASWPENRFDLANTAANPTETVISPATASTLGLDWSLPGKFGSSPAVSGGVAYLSCEKADLCAIDATSGRSLWRTTVGRDDAPLMPVVSRGIVYVGWSRPATVTALDAATGAIRWSSQIEPDGFDLMGPPVVADGLVYQASSADVLHALDAATGARRWATPVTSPSSPAIVDGVLYVGGSRAPRDTAGTLYALRATTGEILWTRATRSTFRLSSPVLSDGRVYLSLANGYFSAPAPGFAAYGLAACTAGPCQPRWSYTSSLGFSGPAAVDGGVVYQAFYDGYLHALDALTGRLLWQGATIGAGSGVWPGPPTVANGLVIASGDDGYVYAWPTTGCANVICRPIWAGNVGGRTQQHVSGSEATVVDGHLFVVNSAGVLFSFSPKATPPPPPPSVERSTVRSWGLGNVGQLGTGQTGDSTVPRLSTGTAGVTKLSGGGFHTVALAKNGTASGWGWGTYGQANGGQSDSAAPVKVPNLAGVRDISAGIYHSLIVTGAEGTVWAMGSNQFGAFGTGPDQAGQGGPVVVPGLSGVRSVAAGGLHSLALREDGTVWAWGLNTAGQLGTGSTTDSVRPVPVPGLNNVVAVSAGLYHSLALKDDGTVWAWGWNGLGQLGTGRPGAVSLLPAPVEGLTGITSISAGGLHSLAVSLDGKVWAWGSNGVGQLGTGHPGDIARTPALVPIDSVATVAGGGYHTMALKTDGTIWTWGWNRFGQLGTGSTTDSAVPLRVAGIQGATAIASGLAHSTAAGP